MKLTPRGACPTASDSSKVAVRTGAAVGDGCGEAAEVGFGSTPDGGILVGPGALGESDPEVESSRTSTEGVIEVVLGSLSTSGIGVGMGDGCGAGLSEPVHATMRNRANMANPATRIIVHDRGIHLARILFTALQSRFTIAAHPPSESRIWMAPRNGRQ